MKTIAVVTVGRSDYGIYLPVLREICRRPSLKLQLIVSGMHLSPTFGETVREIEADGFEIADRVKISPSSDTPEETAKAMGAGTAGFAQVLNRLHPDILALLGDRFEMHAAAVAAVPLRIPIAHIHGGELTQGAIDDAFRHSISKLSHLHFVSIAEYGRRLEQMGEEPWRIVVSGAPSLDKLNDFKPSAAEDFKKQLGLPSDNFLLVTYHPETLDSAPVEQRFGVVLEALTRSESAILFTMANADPGGQLVNQMIREFTGSNSKARLVENLGATDYFNAMAHAGAMIGNSSSGIIEAASFHLPVVNIGNRQKGRISGPNVLHTSYDSDEIQAAIKKAQSGEFRQQIAAIPNPYGNGTAAKKIVDRLESVPIDHNLLLKKFHDL